MSGSRRTKSDDVESQPEAAKETEEDQKQNVVFGAVAAGIVVGFAARTIKDVAVVDAGGIDAAVVTCHGVTTFWLFAGRQTGQTGRNEKKQGDGSTESNSGHYFLCFRVFFSRVARRALFFFAQQKKTNKLFGEKRSEHVGFFL